CVFFQADATSFGSSAYAYIWDKNNGSKTITSAWPGTKATALGGGVYKFVIPDGATADTSGWMIIWNPGGDANKSSDLPYKERGLWVGHDYNSIAYNSQVTTLCADVPQPEPEPEPEPEPDPTPDYPVEDPCTGALPDPEPHYAGSSTAVENIEMPIANMFIYVHNGILYIDTPEDLEMNLYTATGMLVRHLELHSGVNAVEGLQKGVYIGGGQKVIVY
ncbi:MAG: starch-binding protein, partial [Bacteroidales bacterium]|nr:starch-binding protein [Bacteroidales bacterium]